MARWHGICRGPRGPRLAHTVHPAALASLSYSAWSLARVASPTSLQSSARYRVSLRSAWTANTSAAVPYISISATGRPCIVLLMSGRRTRERFIHHRVTIFFFALR